MIIGISPRLSEDKMNLKLSLKYYEYFEKANFSLIVIPFNNYERILKICNGFIISGGGDINPKYYKDNSTFINYDEKIDKIDEIIFKYAKKFNIPLFGICRGMQVIIGMDNGSLYNDISQLYNNLHFDNLHYVNKINNFFTTNFPNKFITNSFHHQAVKDISNDYLITFKCDKIIEGIVHKTKPIFGVQWHPERFDSEQSILLLEIFKEMVMKMQNNHKHKLISDKLLYDGKIIKLSSKEYLLPNGVKAFREIIDHNGGVGILVKNNDEFIFVKQFRHATNKTLLEIPAGKIELHEDPLECAKREIQEEIGYKANSFTYLGKFYPTCGYSSEIIYLYFATDLVMSSLPKDEDEEIEIVKYKENEIKDMIKNNLIDDGKTLLALLLYFNNIK